MGGRIGKHKLRCIVCGSEYGPAPIHWCGECGGLLEVVMELPKRSIFVKIRGRRWFVWRYRELLPVDREDCIVSLYEGGTRLLGLGEFNGLSVYVKVEGDNPTGSFKDRGMTVGVSKAVEFGFNKVACASTGNTSASLAAYAARAGLEAFVFLPRGKVARGKLFQAIAYGAKIIEVDGSFDDALRTVVNHVKEGAGAYLLNSVNPYRLEGQKTLAYEVYEQLGSVPDYVFVPVGNAGNISAIWKGFKELRDMDLIDSVPVMVGVQARGAAPLVDMYRGDGVFRPVENPETIATAIRIGNPVNWRKAWSAVSESGGWFLSVSDGEIVRAQLELARRFGILVEPASASAYAGFLKDIDKLDGTVVIVTTGHGLKDPDVLSYWDLQGLV